MEDLDIIFEEDEITKDNEINEENISDVLKQTYHIIDDYNSLINNLNIKNKDMDLLNLKFESSQNKYDILKNKYENKLEELDRNSIEIKKLKKEVIEKEKKILMLKSLLELIINKYGIDSISKITRLNLEQIKKYLD